MKIRTTLLPGDLSFIISAHAEYYHRELGYTEKFEYVVAKSAVEFYEAYDPKRSRIWIIEDDAGERQASLVLHDRGRAAQLRYFLILPKFQGKGLGRKLLHLFMAFTREKGYLSSYLWTTDDQEIAVRLYESFGYRLVEERPSSAFGKPLMDRKYEVVF
ncbi:GNAT family N-acetyltransferase [Neolewinella persica]|uniref:GNAT family N-acetyltransferase n=1 Tax=Neolewinella persica TaxID=70998 RepID=UPI0003661CF3|nr:GNAT family N-acetyltransferase [Neolewinella persica]